MYLYTVESYWNKNNIKGFVLYNHDLMSLIPWTGKDYIESKNNYE